MQFAHIFPYFNHECFEFNRYIRIAQGCYSRGECRWDILVNLGDMRHLIDDRCTLLRWIGYIHSRFWWWLCIHLRSLRSFPRLSLSLGCIIHFCVRETLFAPPYDSPYSHMPQWNQFFFVVYLIRPTTNAIMGLTFANYVIQPFFDDCAVPVAATQLLAALTICKHSFNLMYEFSSPSWMKFTYIDLFMKCIILFACGILFRFPHIH